MLPIDGLDNPKKKVYSHLSAVARDDREVICLDKAGKPPLGISLAN